MRHHTLVAVLAAVLVLLAGCTGGVGPAAEEIATPDPTDTTGGDTAAGGTVTFYLSDEANAIDDFEHLNVTVTEIGFQRAGNETGGEDDATTDGDDADDADAGGDGWVTASVDDRTVDLTRLQGANATRLTTMDVPHGSYTTVFAHVSSIEATLTTGEEVRVKLPSEKLQIQTRFTVGDGEAVDFVFDITVTKAGNSGKYVLQPVVSESGTGEQVDIREVPDAGQPADAPSPVDLRLAFDGPAVRGESATLVVLTRDGESVPNATVALDDERAGTTDEDGELTVTLPDADEVTVTVRADGQEARLERTLAGGGGGNETTTGADSDYGAVAVSLSGW
jgi:hypothetical protein